MKSNPKQQLFYSLKYQKYQPTPNTQKLPQNTSIQNNSFNNTNNIYHDHHYLNYMYSAPIEQPISYKSNHSQEQKLPLNDLQGKQHQNSSQEKSDQINQNYSDQSNLSHEYHEQSQQKFAPQSQSHPESIKLNIRSQLIRRTRKYQISTNNAHKKYINSLKNLFYQALSQSQIQQFQQKYIKLKSNRVFFFIILVYIKYRFSQQLSQAVKEGFYDQMNHKIKEYIQQIMKCNDFMLKNYRYQEIHQIQIALKAIDQFYLGNTPLAVEYLYRKDKHIIVKQNHFRTSLKLIQDLQKQFASIQGPKITQPYLKNHYHRKIISPAQEKQKQHTFNIYLNELANIKIISTQNEQIEPQKVPQNVPSHQTQEIQEIPQKEDEQQMESIQQENSESQEQNEEQQQQSQSYISKSNQNQSQNQEIDNNHFRSIKEKEKNPIQDIIFPPIPPYFYLPNFDQKYGHLYRRLVYIKSWRQLNQRFQNEDYNLNNTPIYKGNTSVPSPLVFGPQGSLFNRKN